MINSLGNGKVLINTVRASVFSCLIYVREFIPRCLSVRPLHTLAITRTLQGTRTHPYTHMGLEERHCGSYERSQRLLSLRSDAEYLTINYSWISEALILEPWTCQLWLTPPPTAPCVCVCVRTPHTSFRPYLLMEASEAPESWCIFNDVKLSFRSAVCCSKEKKIEGWIQWKWNKLHVVTTKDKKTCLSDMEIVEI